MSTPFVGEIRTFGFNFAPRGWLACNGQILPIAQNTALFSLLGTTYGGNGTSNFALPNMQGRAPVHSGNDSAGPGLTARELGEAGGEPTVQLLLAQIPAHNHQLQSAQAANAAQQTGTPSASAFLGNSLPGPAYSAASPPINAQFSPKAIGLTGGGLPHNNLQPIQAVGFCIATQGIFPARN